MPAQTQIQTRRGTAASWTSTNPTLAAGEIGFETDTGKFKIGNGSTAWAALAYSAGATAVTYLFNATSGQTTFSGADANGLTLAYTVGAEQVYLNGVLQVRGSDYTGTDGTSIVLASGALTSDVLNVIAYSAMTITDTYTQAQADAKFIPNALVDAKADLITATASDTPARIGVGADGTVLTADSAEATGLKWATAGGGGKVLQVVSASVTTSTSIATTTYTDTGLTATITPTASTSKILVLIMNHFYWSRGGTEANVTSQLLRGATAIGNIGGDKIWGHYNAGSTSQEGRITLPVTFLDSPATTSATTYKTQAFTQTGTTTNWNNGFGSSIVLMEIGA